MGFNYWNKDLQKVQNSQLGSYTILSTSPLAVRFTVRSGARWSDGTPITAVDLLFSHLISSSAYSESAGLISGTNANPTFDSTNYFNFYDRAISQIPQLSNDKQSMTLTYSNSFPDWEMFTPTPFPVHALALLTRGASGLQSLAANLVYKNEFESAFMSRNTNVLKSYASAFNSLYSVSEVNERTNPLLLVNSGPYMLDFANKAEVRLKKNLNYNSGPSLSGIDSIVYKILPSAEDTQAALKNGEVDIAQGSISQESVNFYKGLTQNKFISYDTSTFEHLDLRVGASLPGETYVGPFAGSSSKARDLRKAFLLAFPRQEILNKVIKPIAPHAILPTSFLRMESEKGHDEIAIRSGFLSSPSSPSIAPTSTCQH
jgi:peptide/nickel transport system substrate-binding protein